MKRSAHPLGRGEALVWSTVMIVALAPLVGAPGDGHQPWAHAAALIGVITLYILLTVLIRQHLGAVSRGAAVQGLCAAAAHAALLVVVLEAPLRSRSGRSAAATELVLSLVAASVVLAAMGFASMFLTRTRRDQRLAAFSCAALAVGLACSTELVQIIEVFGDVSGVVSACAIGAIILLAVGGAASAAPMQPVLREAPRIELVGSALVGLQALGIVVWAQWHAVPSAAVMFAVSSLVAVVLKLLLVVSELLALRSFEEAALVDDLTGLPNRVATQRKLVAVRSGGGRGAVLLFGMDGLRDVNDVLGRGVGDVVLRSVAARLVEASGPAEAVARIGGDAFLTYIAEADLGQAHDRAVTIRRAITAPLLAGGRSVDVRTSVGISMVGWSQCPQGDVDALQAAELALRTARETRQAIVPYGNEMHDAMFQRLDLATDLRAAFSRKQFVLHFQPQVDARGLVHGAEALVRWQHPTLGTLPPDRFLPLVEELGLQSDLTAWVLTTALEEAAGWHREGLALSVAVNLSPDDLDEALVNLVLDLLNRAGIPPHRLVVEITETTLLRDPQHAAAVLQALVDHGVCTSIDDYGTGYSSLSLLLQLPVTELKIDRSFVSRLLIDERSRVLVQATIELAHRLGMRVVAEGVEDPDVLATLVELHCDVTQGWIHHRAVPGSDLMSWVNSRPALAQVDAAPAIAATLLGSASAPI